tara:strand:+ start:1295 stop:1753 length:459 start_codon:yes stop_codon:yes gene_type:complete
MKNITLIILILFLYNCGYSSVYKNQKSQNFRIDIIKTEGDRDMNNLIKNEINLYSNNNSMNTYSLKINTDYKKEILTKNSSGEITDFTLSVTSIFVLKFNDITQNMKFEESIDIKNQSNSFEQNIYEQNIQKNFASSIREKLFSKIYSLNDN